MSLTSLIFISLGIIFLLVYFVLLILLKDKQVSLANTFGYEIYSSLSIERRLLLYFLLFIFSSLSSIGIWILLSLFASTYLIIVSVLFLLGFSLISISNIIPFTFYKYHFSTYYFGSAFIISSSLLMLLAKYVNGIVIDNDMIPHSISILYGIISITLLVFLGNPNNTSWFKLNKVSTNNETSYEKPKVNSLAIEEWLSLGLLGLIDILFILLNISL